MNTFSDYNAIRQFVSDRMPSDLSVYDSTEEVLIDYGTSNLHADLTVEFHLVYGVSLPCDWFEQLYGQDGAEWYRIFD